MKKFRCHDLRHSFASNWMRAGEDLFTLSKVLGHSSITTTERYAHLAPEAFDQVTAMGGARDGAARAEATADAEGYVARLMAENEALRGEVERLQAETSRQQRVIDRLLGE